MAVQEDTHFVSIRLPRQVARQLRVMAAERDLTRHRLIQQIVAEWLLQRGFGDDASTPSTSEAVQDAPLLEAARVGG